MDFMEFGRQNSHCHVLAEGFLLWEVTGKDEELPVILEDHGANFIVHVLMLEGVMKMGWEGKLYPMMKGSFVNFMDGHSLQIQEVSWDAKAYIMFFTDSFIRSLLKGHPPFTPSYVIRVKLWPVMTIPSETVQVNIREQHSVAWYASQLCVTPQYLNRAVKSTSQKTVSDHICTTLIGTIAEELENTENPISQIALDFHFPDLATLTKFFKRQTGMTPTEYRKWAAR